MNTTILIIFFIFFFIFNLLLQSKIGKKITSTNKIFFITIGIVTFIQLITALLYIEEVSDVYLFKTAGNYLRQRIDFYWIDSDHNQYPFFPFLIFYHALLDWLTEVIPQLKFMFLIKLSLLFPLHYLAYWVKNNSKNIKIGRQKYLELITSPITYLVIFFHGQIDIILMAFFVLSIQPLQQKTLTIKNVLISSALYAASIASKTWSILFAPILLWHYKKEWKILLLFISTGILLLGNIFAYTRFVFGSSVSTVLPSILRPGGPIGIWGITLISGLQPFIIEFKLPLYALLLSIGYIFLFRKKLTFWQSITLFILWIYIVSIHWAVQYLIWILPFAILFKDWLGKKWFSAFHLLASLYVLGSYINVANSNETISKNLIAVIGLGIWLLVIKKFTQKVLKITFF